MRGLDAIFMVCGIVLPSFSLLFPLIASWERTIPKKHLYGLFVMAILCWITWLAVAGSNYTDMVWINLAFACSTPQVFYFATMWWKWRIERRKSALPQAEVVSDQRDPQ